MKYGEALKYPYRHYLDAMVFPGLVVYVDILLMLIFLAVIVGICLLLGMTLPHFFDGLKSAGAHVSPGLQNVQALSARFLREDIPMFSPMVSKWGYPFPAIDFSFVTTFPDLLANSAGSGDWSGTLERLSDKGGGGNFNGGGRWNGLLYTLFWTGFEWHLFARFQKGGFEAAPPAWADSWKGFLKDGFKGSVFYFLVYGLPMASVFLAIVLGVFFLGLNGQLESLRSLSDSELMLIFLPILGIIAVLSLLSFFIGPFFIAPMVHTAQNPSFRGLFNIGKAIEITLPRYWKILQAFLFIGLTFLIYLAGTLVVCVATCCVGMLLSPFFWEGAFRVTATHLIAQAFDYQPAAAKS